MSTQKDQAQPQGFTRAVKVVSFRPTREQRDELERVGRELGITPGQVARRRCFPQRTGQAPGDDGAGK